MRRAVSLSLSVLTLALCVGCGSDAPIGAPPGEVRGDPMRIPTPTFAVATEPEVSVDALDNTFRLKDMAVPAGTPVKWINKGINGHDVIPVDQAAAWGVPEGEFLPGAEYAHVFVQPGTYDYYCSLHGTTTAGMVGSITVVEG